MGLFDLFRPKPKLSCEAAGRILAHRVWRSAYAAASVLLGVAVRDHSFRAPDPLAVLNELSFEWAALLLHMVHRAVFFRRPNEVRLISSVFAGTAALIGIRSSSVDQETYPHLEDRVHNVLGRLTQQHDDYESIEESDSSAASSQFTPTMRAVGDFYRRVAMILGCPDNPQYLPACVELFKEAAGRTDFKKIIKSVDWNGPEESFLDQSRMSEELNKATAATVREIEATFHSMENLGRAKLPL